MERDETNDRNAERLAKGLGWFSIGLGLAEMSAPGAVARLIGIRGNGTAASTMRALGAREIAHGVAILTQPDRATWLWTRVGGDLLDLSYLGSALRSEDCDRGRVMAAAAAVLGVTALDVMCAGKLSRANGASAGSTFVAVEQAITINRPIEEVYQFWRNFENLPRFMRHLQSVEIIDPRRSRWRAKGPAGTTVEWEAEIVQDVRDEWIAWRSVEHADVHNSGSVRFQRAPGARGTELRVQLRYSPPAGAVGRTIAWLFGEEPDQQVRDDLRRFKQVMETGEIPLSEGPGLWRAAQPPANAEQIKALAGVH